jgi:hypothetical protein
VGEIAYAPGRDMIATVWFAPDEFILELFLECPLVLLVGAEALLDDIDARSPG